GVIFERLIVSNNCCAKTPDFAIVGFACFYRVERRCPQSSSNRSPTVREPHASRNADIFCAGGRTSLLNSHLHEQSGRHPCPAILCDLIDEGEIVIHLSRAEIQSWGTFVTNRLCSLNLWHSQFRGLIFKGRHRGCASCILRIGSACHQRETPDTANCNHKNHKRLFCNNPYWADRD